MSDKLARAEAEHAAVQVVKDCGFTAFPICPFEIAKKYDIHVEAKQSSKPGVSGFLLRECLRNSVRSAHSERRLHAIHGGA
jgi:hypothetical protein